MSLARLGGMDPGQVGIFAGALLGQRASVQGEVAREIESLGYGTLWYGEGAGREAFAQGAILLSATSRLVIASGIANIWARDAAATAAGGRTLAAAWPGRFILGIGVSHAHLVEARGHQYARPYSTMREYLERMAEAPWRGPEVAPPPIVLAALGPRMMALAAQRTAGAYPYFTTTDHVRQAREQLGPEPFMAADLPVVLAADRAEARAIGNAHMSVYLGTPNYRNNLLRLGWKAEDLEPPGSDEIFDAIVAWGGVDAVRERIDHVLEAGADQVALNLITRNRNVPYLAELRALAPQNSHRGVH